MSFRAFMMLNARLQFVLLYTVGEDALQAAAEDVSAALEDGVLEVGEEHGLPCSATRSRRPRPPTTRSRTARSARC